MGPDRKPQRPVFSEQGSYVNHIHIVQVRPKSVYRVSPVEGEIPPERSLEITVTACLDDCVRYVL